MWEELFADVDEHAPAVVGFTLLQQNYVRHIQAAQASMRMCSPTHSLCSDDKERATDGQSLKMFKL